MSKTSEISESAALRMEDLGLKPVELEVGKHIAQEIGETDKRFMMLAARYYINTILTNPEMYDLPDHEELEEKLYNSRHPEMKKEAT